MRVTYKKLWIKLVEKDMRKLDLLKATRIGFSTLSKLSRNQLVRMDVLLKICKCLNCDIGDIVSADPDLDEIDEDDLPDYMLERYRNIMKNGEES